MKRTLIRTVVPVLLALAPLLSSPGIAGTEAASPLAASCAADNRQCATPVAALVAFVHALQRHNPRAAYGYVASLGVPKPSYRQFAADRATARSWGLFSVKAAAYRVASKHQKLQITYTCVAAGLRERTTTGQVLTSGGWVPMQTASLTTWRVVLPDHLTSGGRPSLPSRTGCAHSIPGWGSKKVPGAHISASKAAVSPGKDVIFKGHGFDADESVSILLDAKTGTPSGRLHANSLGNIGDANSGFIVLPPIPYGKHTVYAVGQHSSLIAATHVTVSSLMAIYPTAAVPNQTVSFSGEGFGANETVKLQLVCPSSGSCPSNTNLGTVTADASGSFRGATVTLPTDIAGGDYTVQASGPSGAAASSSLHINAQLSVAPHNGQTGGSAQVSGVGFAPNDTVTITWDGTSLTTVTTDANGSFSNASVTIPTSAFGSHNIAATGSGGIQAQTTFSVRPTATLSSTSGAPGTVVDVSGSGFAAGESVAITWDCQTAPCSAAQTLQTVTANAQGSIGPVAVTVPAATRGPHSVVVTGATSAVPLTRTFLVKTQLAVNPASGAPGSTITFSGSGFLADETVTFTWDCASPTCASSTVLGTGTTDANGTLPPTSVTIPAKAKPGKVGIRAAGSKGTFAYIGVTVQSS